MESKNINRAGIQRGRKKSEYGKQLAEKQELKKIYGLREGQLKKYVTMARNEAGNTSENMLIILERRLDNVIYQLGFAQTRPQARQFSTHGLFKLNGKRVDIPSILVKIGDTVEPAKPTRFNDEKVIPRADWLTLNTNTLKGGVKTLPNREQISVPINEDLVIQFYSR